MPRVNNVAIDLVSEDLIGVEPRWDVVLAGDVCYERPMAEKRHRLVPRARRRAASPS